jgi:hypothetical protein
MTHSIDRELTIDPRFCGPPDSGNGGYVCGEMAGALGGKARVRLRMPPPLSRALRVASTEGGVGLFEDTLCLAEAWPETLELEVPEPASFEEATRAASAFRGFEEHIFPRCFVCGPDRDEGDGLRIFPGPLEGDRSEIFAAPWIPDASLADGDGWIAPTFVWAALDCPGCFSFPQPKAAIVLLGEMAAELDGRIRPGERCHLLAWQISHEGRKHTTGTAVYDQDGACRGAAKAVWIEVPRD